MKKKKLIKKYKKNNLLEYLILIFVALGIILYLLFNIFNVKSVGDQEFINYEDNSSIKLKISYEDITTDQIIQANEAIGLLDSKFLKLQQNIIFVKNISSYCPNCSGVNLNNGENIYIEMQDNPYLFKYLLCHELLHTLFDLKDQNLEEEIVEKISKRFICYKK